VLTSSEDGKATGYGDFAWLTYGEVAGRIRAFGFGLRALGLPPVCAPSLSLSLSLSPCFFFFFLHSLVALYCCRLCKEFRGALHCLPGSLLSGHGHVNFSLVVCGGTILVEYQN
jgi:hypothetical protein